MTLRRATQWLSTYKGRGNLASGVQDNLLLVNETELGVREVKGATVTRILLDIRLEASSVAQQVQMHWGIVVVNADARAAGAFPDADDYGDRADWLVRGHLRTIQSDLSDASQWDRVRADLRAQRILRSEESELHLIVDAGSDGFTMIWTAFIRVLMKLP